MTNDRLSRAYIEKATVRIKALKFMHQERGYSDVVGEAQECVELLLMATEAIPKAEKIFDWVTKSF